MDDPQKPIKHPSPELKRSLERVKSLEKRQVQSFRDKWFDNQDAMMALRISRRTIQKYRDIGLLPFVRLLGKIFYKIKDVNALMESRYIKRKKTNENDQRKTNT